MSRHKSKVNMNKFLQEEHRRYKMSAYDAYAVETGMNSFGQAGLATKLCYKPINDRFEPQLQITDNGLGMPSKQFDDYHNFYSESSKMVIGDINFLGMGSKPMLPRASHIITETKSADNHLASRWWWDAEQQDVIWDDVYDMKGIDTKTGTRINVYLKEQEDIKSNNVEHLKDLIQYQFMGVLLGEYGERKIFIENGSDIETAILSKYPHPREYPPEHHMIRTIDSLGDFEGKRYPPKCMFVYSKEPFPEGEYGLFIIVGKKTIQCQGNWFGVFPKDDMRQHIRGYIFADYIIDIVNDGKNGFNESSKRWKEFYEGVAKEFAKFLVRIGAEAEKPIVDEDTLKIGEKVAKEFNDNLKKWDLIDVVGERKQKEKPIIPPLSPAICPNCKSIKHTTYEKDEAMWICSDCGAIFPKKWHGKRVGTKRRGAIIFVYWKNVTGDKIYKQAWWDAEEKAIAINTSLPTWNYVEGKAKVSEYYHREVGLKALIEESTQILPEQREEIFFQYFSDFLKD